MDIFQTLGSGLLSVTTMLDFSGRANTSMHGVREDDTANRICVNLRGFRVWHGAVVPVLISSSLYIRHWEFLIYCQYWQELHQLFPTVAESKLQGENSCQKLSTKCFLLGTCECIVTSKCPQTFL